MPYSILQINRRAIAFTVACLIGSAVSNYLLYLDLRSDSGASSGEVLASISRADGEVRRRRASSFIWNPVSQGTELYRRDAVRGASVIEFKNGTQMELGEDSSVVIEDIENLELAFLRGSVIVSNASGTKRITVDRDGQRTTESLPVRLLEPRASQVFLAAPQKPAQVAFRWFSPEPGGLSLEIAKDAGFKNTVKRSESELSHALPAGKYFWRVRKGAGKAETRRFTVLEYPSIALTSPQPQQKIKTIDDSASIVFRWSHASRVPESIASNFRLNLQVAENSAFNPVVHEQEVLASTGRASTTLAARKTYFWRLISADPRLDTKTGAESFTISPQEILPVELLQPAPKASVAWSPKLRLGWGFENPADEFALQVRQKGVDVFSVKTRAPSAEWPQPPPGVYQWKVTALLRGRTVGESASHTFEILPGRPLVLKSPENKARFEFWNESPKLRFEWEHHSLFENGAVYVWELSDSASFDKIAATRKTTAPVLSDLASLPSKGNWYWRVRLEDSSQKRLAESPAKTFYWGPPPILRSVASAKPEAGSEVEFSAKGKLPALVWEPVKGAVAYEVAIRNSEKMVWNRTVKTTETAFPTLREGDYWWTVRAIDLLQRKGEPLLQREVRVRYGRRLSAPEAVKSRVR